MSFFRVVSEIELKSNLVPDVVCPLDQLAGRRSPRSNDSDPGARSLGAQSPESRIMTTYSPKRSALGARRRGMDIPLRNPTIADKLRVMQLKTPFEK
jgi:hypothetical protein